MQHVIEQFEGQIAALQAENESLKQQKQELEQQNQHLQNQLNNIVVPAVPDYLAVRDRILKNWRVAKAPEKKERIMSALDRFIEAITE